MTGLDVVSWSLDGALDERYIGNYWKWTSLEYINLE